MNRINIHDSAAIIVPCNHVPSDDALGQRAAICTLSVYISRKILAELAAAVSCLDSLTVKSSERLGCNQSKMQRNEFEINRFSSEPVYHELWVQYCRLG